MPTLDLNFIAQTFQAALNRPNAPVSRIVTDSRDIQAGDVFFALKGERFDAHDFVDEVLRRGALLCVVSREDCAHKAGCLKVADTERALGKLAQAWRMALQPTVLAITGSSGKTTLKEMTAAVLRHAFGAEAVLATQGNLNNHIGLPLTLLRLRAAHRFAVVEAGMNHAGELAYLTAIARPNTALINNALHAHIGCGFDGVADIARAKSELYQGLADDGLAIFPCEDAHAAIFQAASSNRRQRTFGIERGDVHAEQIVLHPTAVDFDLVIGAERARVKLPAPGRHNVHNALAAAALCMDFLGAAQIAAGLRDYRPSGSRLKMVQAACGARVIDDSYNANPDSMKAAVDVLAAFDAPRVLVMGDMGELGAAAADLHRQIGVYAREKSIEYGFFLGEQAALAAAAFGEKGQHFTDKTALTKALQTLIDSDSAILVKGSRFMKMEEVVQALL
ncbi:MAG: UDP-N-acetylmuramoyl-tripeptide--D-alanyl-D-alanine ligase [Neisseria sp.]|nr:UDP-N-acetylmuramoyl-tripeptide--D-alanyl-D-alanine ligase [Neisseria sp.]